MQYITTPFQIADAYKLSHWDQYPEGTTMVYSNFTPRKSRIQNCDIFVFFGLQAALKRVTDIFRTSFFSQPINEAVQNFKDFYTEFFSVAPPESYCKKVEALHKLQYLPIEVRALAEGSVVNHGIPCFTIKNTLPDFYWVTNFLETWLSAEMWHPCTSATTAFLYKRQFNKYAKETSDSMFMVDFQGHDFSFRGMPGPDASAVSGAGHLTSFLGSDTCISIPWIKAHYPVPDNCMLATSVPATEHSVMSAGSQEEELETYRRLIEDLYPTGIMSIVSDTYDFWKVVTEYLPQLKDKIMARDGKVVIRPDSSPKTPVEIICGDPDALEGTPEYKGLCQCLYEIFGGTTNSKGYIELDTHIGMIYGDSITFSYQKQILEGLKSKGFSSTNVVLGIGSYTYQYVTRDTHGIAIKATAIKKGTEAISIFKDPKTDNGTKKSARGFLKVTKEDGNFVLHQDVTEEEEQTGELQLVYRDGELLKLTSFQEIRDVVLQSL